MQQDRKYRPTCIEVFDLILSKINAGGTYKLLACEDLPKLGQKLGGDREAKAKAACKH